MLSGDCEEAVYFSVDQRRISIKHRELGKSKRSAKRCLEARVLAFRAGQEAIQSVLILYFDQFVSSHSLSLDPLDLSLDNRLHVLTSYVRFVDCKHSDLPRSAARLQGSLHFERDRPFLDELLIEPRALAVAQDGLEQRN